MQQPSRLARRVETCSKSYSSSSQYGSAPSRSVEIGAHEAAFSTRLKTALPTLRAVAFEANPYVYREHSERLHQQAVDYRHAAICNENGLVEFQIPVALTGNPVPPNNAISSLHFRKGSGIQYDTVRVPALTLDAAIEPCIACNSVAWIDAEGAQREIILGGRRFFSQVAAVYIEVERDQVWRDQSTDSEIARRLAEFSLIPVMQDNLAAVQFNEVYVRNTKAISEVAYDLALKHTASLRQLIETA